MDDKGMEIRRLRNEVARWKNRTLEVIEKACYECEEYTEKDCAKCRVRQIKEEATK